jgi:hypothetical protein
MSIEFLGRIWVKERVNKMQLLGELTKSLKMRAAHSFETSVTIYSESHP